MMGSYRIVSVLAVSPQHFYPQKEIYILEYASKVLVHLGFVRSEMQ